MAADQCATQRAPSLPHTPRARPSSDGPHSVPTPLPCAPVTNHMRALTAETRARVLSVLLHEHGAGAFASLSHVDRLETLDLFLSVRRPTNHTCA